jgi:hypothetical protein
MDRVGVNKMRTHFQYSEAFPGQSVDAQDTMRVIHRIVETRLAEQIAKKLEQEKQRQPE